MATNRPDSEVVQIKSYTSIRAPIDVIIPNTLDFEIRKKWDTVLYDFRTFFITPDMSYSRVSYAFKSPFPVAHRDFYIQQVLRRDYPEPGMSTMHVKSLTPNEKEMPNEPKRVRATIMIIGYVTKECRDERTGEIYQKIFMTNCLDING